MKQTAAPKNIDEYIESFPKDVQKLLQRIRLTIRKAAPDAAETIKYQIPTFTLNGNLVHFGAYKNHIGFYPAPSGIAEFQKEVAPYHESKGTLRFSFDQPIPFDLIGKIVKFRVKKNLEKAKGKKN
jgi:uncharacterized protein YdhG (YjbR/CyaY superfamily)